MQEPKISTVITDLDNTLFDWMRMWFKPFRSFLDGLVAITGTPESQILNEIRAINQKYRTTEYSFLLYELPSLKELNHGKDPYDQYGALIDSYKSQRDALLSLYPSVESTLRTIKAHGTLIVGFTESIDFQAKNRVRKLGLDGLLDYLYSPEDHSIPEEVSFGNLRKHEDSHYALRLTKQRFLPKGQLKPDSRLLDSILEEVMANKKETIYIGDNLRKDMSMATNSQLIPVHAKYGETVNHPGYGLLKKVSFWKDSEIARETKFYEEKFQPDYTIHAFAEILDHFQFVAFKPTSTNESR